MTIFTVFILLLSSCSQEVKEDQTATKKAIESKIGSIENTDLKKINALKGKLTLSIPSDFNIMSNEMLLQKYPSGNRPTEVYTNKSGSVNIAVNHTANMIKIEQLPELLPVFEQQFTALYPNIKWLKKELVKINNRDFILLEFETPAIDTPIYNLMAVSSLDGRMLMGSFNCPIGMKGEWKEKANQIINSIKVKE